MHYVGQTHTDRRAAPGRRSRTADRHQPKRSCAALSRPAIAAHFSRMLAGIPDPHRFVADGRDRPPAGLRSRRARARAGRVVSRARGCGTRPVWFDGAMARRRDLVAARSAGRRDRRGSRHPRAAGRDDRSSIPASRRASTRSAISSSKGSERERFIQCRAAALRSAERFPAPERRLWPRAARRSRRSPRCPRVSKPLADLVRASKAAWIVSTHFTLVPGKGGEPMISPHLKKLRPFLAQGRFPPGRLGPRAGRRTRARRFVGREGRLFRLLHDPARMGAAQGGHREARMLAASSPTAASLRRCATRMCATSTTVLLADGCAAFSPEIHETAIAALRPVRR